jgi:3-hexulose-6-phosphate synthase
MKLQLALDRLTREKCIQLVKETEANIDWIEIGTGVIKEYGMAMVREMRELFPGKVIVADMKTCDAGAHETMQAFEAGADITTVMAFSNDRTIKDTIEVAKEYNKRIMIDLLEVESSKRMEELHRLGVDLVSLHVGKDKQKEGAFDEDLFSLVKPYPFEVTVAGGLNESSLPGVIPNNPDVVIIGSAITKAENPSEAAARIKEMIGN